MIILNREEFLDIESDVVFAKYNQRRMFGELKIKTLEHDGDFLYQNILEVDAEGLDDLIEILGEAIENKTSIKLDNNRTYRDGLFERDQLFAVYEKKDLKKLIKRLKEVLKDMG